VRYLVISDIHANWEALQAVLTDSKGLYERIVNCGDLVGYGPEPNRVVDWCRANTPSLVRGNHDKACAGLVDLEWFNVLAKESALWTRGQLTPQNLSFLHDLPQGPRPVDGFQLVHGSPADEDEYLVDTWDVHQIYRAILSDLYFFGHSHVQGGFWVHRNGVRELEFVTVALERDLQYLVNPGSVGQPRDGDPRAAYALYDSEDGTVEFRRAAYDIAATQAKMLKAGLPELLASRLSVGR
jgi:diadenosine tetraphosphatase ApaH/serine/threonine PP2A family protein phosphatase